VAERDAESKKREAEGVEAISAAPGLAAAKVQIATAQAKLASFEAEATGKEKIGLADVHVRAADADAILKAGQADAQVIEARSQAEAAGMRAKFEAEATGKEKLGLAEVNVRTADAEATLKSGQADAQVIEARFGAEAKGLHEKFEAMKSMSPETRDHEEFRMRLEKSHIETLKGIEAQTAIAKEQAEVLGTALSNAKIDIVGGQGDYFDSFVRSLSVGKGIDGVISKSNAI
jgi:hypothetical protein